MENKIKLLSAFIVCFALVIAAIALIGTNNPYIPIFNSDDAPKQFSSLAEMKTFLSANSMNYFGGRGGMLTQGAPNMAITAESDSAGSSKSASSYSTTNIQVAGVDEADFIKNDGKYIYSIFNNVLTITEAYPSESMKLIYEQNISGADQLFINGDKLVVFANSYRSPSTLEKISCLYGGCGHGYSQNNILVYDIEDKTSPLLEQNISIDGNYIQSRMIGDYVYVISSKTAYADNPEPPVYIINGQEKTTSLQDIYYFPYPDNYYNFNTLSSVNLQDGAMDSKVFLAGYSQNIYVSEENIYLTSTEQFNYKSYYEKMINDVYLSLSPITLKQSLNNINNENINIYQKLSKMAQAVRDYSDDLEGDARTSFDQELQEKLIKFEEDIAKEREKTIIHKLSIDNGQIEYQKLGRVPGHVLNQFSLDEKDGNLRIATTLGNSWGRGGVIANSSNNLFILDHDLNQIGSVEGLAEGESIYSVRFLEDKAYIVTFRQVDPLFVIDLSNPNSPEVLGFLKITGFSNYLHPYDATHLIGIGNEATEEGRLLGMKVSLFDVSDFANPREVAKLNIGDRGTSSQAQYDHKAVLFDKEKGILVIPLSLAESEENDFWGSQIWQGAYVLNVNENEISIRGKITHQTEVETLKPASQEPIGAKRLDWSGNIWEKIMINSDGVGYWETNVTYYDSLYRDSYIDSFPNGSKDSSKIYDYKTQIQRSLYMNDLLFTVSPSKIKANNLISMDELNKINLPYFEYNYPYYGLDMEISSTI